MKDSIVEEVRKTRAKILKTCNYDIRSFAKLANSEVEQFKKEQSEFLNKNPRKILPKKVA